MSTTKITEEDRYESLNLLRELLPLGAPVYTIVRSVSRSGMQRSISVYALTIRNNEPSAVDITMDIANVIEAKLSRNGEGISVHGTGMNMAGYLVMRLGRKMFPDGFAQKGPGRNGDMSGWESDGSYAFTQRSL